jgi:hypothetical protein
MTSQTHPARTLSGFHAVIHRIGENIDSEFGDHGYFTGTNHQDCQNIVQDASISEPDITSTEFPWADGDIHELGTNISPTSVS